MKRHFLWVVILLLPLKVLAQAQNLNLVPEAEVPKFHSHVNKVGETLTMVRRNSTDQFETIVAAKRIDQVSTGLHLYVAFAHNASECRGASDTESFDTYTIDLNLHRLVSASLDPAGNSISVVAKVFDIEEGGESPQNVHFKIYLTRSRATPQAPCSGSYLPSVDATVVRRQ